MLSNSVLVVEDERVLRGLIERVLTDAGFRVLSAGRASEAFALWDSGGRSLAVALIDCSLGDAPRGEEIARRISAENQSTRVILMSGQPPTELESGGWPAGWRFLAKPFSPSDLTRVIREAFASSPG